MKRLILDAGGVLFSENFREYLGGLAETHGCDRDQFVTFYNSGPRNRLWRGEESLTAFWDEIAHELGLATAPPEFDEQAAALFEPLEALARLPDWSRRSELWLLSNHRHEWLRPMLSQYGVVFANELISSELGAMKPEPAIFRGLLTGDPEAILFVDDRQDNLDAAVAVTGPRLETLLADSGGRWLVAVERWLSDEIHWRDFASPEN